MSSDPPSEARAYLGQADALLAMPFHPNPSLPPEFALRELEKRDREVLQLHIRALVAASEDMKKAVERLDQGED